MPQEQVLAASFYGKFFARNLNLHLLKRRPEEWKELQSSSMANAKEPESKQASGSVQPQEKQQSPAINDHDHSPKKSSRKRTVPEDEIDALFSAALGNKVKSGAAGSILVHEKASPTDREMQDVMRAIRAVPHESSHPRKRRKT